MKKINLYGIGNSKNYNFYIFDKNKKVHKKLNEIFEDIFEIPWPTTKRIGGEENPEEISVDISKYKDFHESLQITANEFKTKKRIDIFYGNKRIFLVIHCPKKLRKQFNERLKEISEFPEITYDETKNNL